MNRLSLFDLSLSSHPCPHYFQLVLLYYQLNIFLLLPVVPLLFLFTSFSLTSRSSSTARFTFSYATSLVLTELSPFFSCSSRDFRDRSTFLSSDSSSMLAYICRLPYSRLAFTYNSSFISAWRAYSFLFFCSSSRVSACRRRSSNPSSPPQDLRSSAVRLTEWVLMAGRLASLPNLLPPVLVSVLARVMGAVYLSSWMEVVFSRRRTLTLWWNFSQMALSGAREASWKQSTGRYDFRLKQFSRMWLTTLSPASPSLWQNYIRIPLRVLSESFPSWRQFLLLQRTFNLEEK